MDLPPPFLSNFLFTNLFSIKFLYFFIISSLFPHFNLFVSIFIQSYANIKLHVSTLYRYQGRIQDLLLGAGAWVGEGSGGRSPGGRGANPPGSSGGLRYYRHLFERQFWTNHTIFIRPKKLDFEPWFCRININSMFLSDYKNLK